MCSDQPHIQTLQCLVLRVESLRRALAGRMHACAQVISMACAPGCVGRPSPEAGRSGGACAQVISCRPDQLVPANPVILDGIADLTGLTYLNEPSILHGLNLRYGEDQIYTHAGPVLIAINPFKQARSRPLNPENP